MPPISFKKKARSRKGPGGSSRKKPGTRAQQRPGLSRTQGPPKRGLVSTDTRKPRDNRAKLTLGKKASKRFLGGGQVDGKIPVLRAAKPGELPGPQVDKAATAAKNAPKAKPKAKPAEPAKPKTLQQLAAAAKAKRANSGTTGTRKFGASDLSRRGGSTAMKRGETATQFKARTGRLPTPAETRAANKK